MIPRNPLGAVIWSFPPNPSQGKVLQGFWPNLKNPWALGGLAYCPFVGECLYNTQSTHPGEPVLVFCMAKVRNLRTVKS